MALQISQTTRDLVFSVNLFKDVFRQISNNTGTFGGGLHAILDMTADVHGTPTEVSVYDGASASVGT